MRISQWQNERLGLIMIAASLLVISVIILLLFHYQQQNRVAQIKTQGISLVRLLSGIPYEHLIPTGQRGNLLQLIRHSQDNPDFAYAVLVDAKGYPLNEATMPGVIVPRISIPNEPSSWIGQRNLRTSDDVSVLEHHGPVFSQGESSQGNLAGYVRLGYFEPGFGLTQGQLPFIATMALPIFLLTPMFYFLLKRETKPLKQIGRSMEQLLDQGRFTRVEIQASGELLEFSRKFNQFVELAQNRISQLEEDQSQLQTSAKLLSYKRDRIETVLHSIPEGVVILDESGMVSFVNERLTQLLCVELADVEGSDIRDWCNDPEVLDYLASHRNSLGSGVRYSSGAIEFSPSAMADKTIAMTAYPLFPPGSEDTLLGTLLVFRDVSEEVMARNGRSEFIAQVAHELKTPLTVLAMYSEALLGEDGQSEQFRVEAINVIYDEVERLSMLINNLLSLKKIGSGSLDLHRQRVKLRDLLEDCFSTVARSSKNKGLSFEINIPRDFAILNLDKDLIRVAINNLLTNAIKYNNPGGKVYLNAEEIGDKVEISVKDTGIGIDKQDMHRIFDKFYRSDSEEVRKRTGHGLGLSLAKEIVQLHHGELVVDSTPGEGSEFKIIFINEAVPIAKAV